jgi:hypothetical protein
MVGGAPYESIGSYINQLDRCTDLADRFTSRCTDLADRFTSGLPFGWSDEPLADLAIQTELRKSSRVGTMLVRLFDALLKGF